MRKNFPTHSDFVAMYELVEEPSYKEALKDINKDLADIRKELYYDDESLAWLLGKSGDYYTFAVEHRSISYVCDKLYWLELVCLGPLSRIYFMADHYLTCVFKERSGHEPV